MTDFFEPDEPVERVREVFESGEKRTTAPPVAASSTVYFDTRPQRNLPREAAHVLAQHWYASGHRYNVTVHDGLYDMEIIEGGRYPMAVP